MAPCFFCARAYRHTMPPKASALHRYTVFTPSLLVISLQIKGYFTVKKGSICMDVCIRNSSWPGKPKTGTRVGVS